ncbi:hypothetical protein N7510_002718 [Penicillium lagena]|uniref:uncharacterized protein n=1 Tax=Penicillium lagena TaxID=94218 RepID=UPI0025404818|nr:uncharacterized protein N7510_002718 [Penicillium lagena]KAJ5626409.1 hypothetical protein N7510_002718 [Penicillium lagena]
MSSSYFTPARPPPDGLVSNFVNPTSCGTKFIVVNCIFLPIAFLSIAIRVWTRTFVTLVELGMGRHMWDVLMSNYSPKLLQLNLSAAIFYNAGTGFLKVSVLLFYIRIFPSSNLHIAVWVLIFIAAGYNIAGVLANIFSCNPINKTWDVHIFYGTCINRPVFYFVNAGLGIVTDFATTMDTAVTNAVPTEDCYFLYSSYGMLVSSAQSLWSTSVLINIASYSEMALTKSGTSVEALLWCLIELDLGITGACLPAMRPFVRKYFPRLLGLSANSSSGDHHPSPYDQNLYLLHPVSRTRQAALLYPNYQYPLPRTNGKSLSQEQIFPQAAE